MEQCGSRDVEYLFGEFLLDLLKYNHMDEIGNLTERNKRVIAFYIIYYFKRLIICGLFFVLYYLIIYNKYFVGYVEHEYYESWIFNEYISYYDFLQLIFHSFFFITISIILLARPISNAYRWIKKYSS